MTPWRASSGVSVVTTVEKIERVIMASGVSVVTTVEKIERVITASGVSVVTTVEKIERVITASGVSVVTTVEKIGRAITAMYCPKLQPLNKNVPWTLANHILPNYANRNTNQWLGIHDNVKYIRLEYLFLNNSDIAWCDPMIKNDKHQYRECSIFTLFAMNTCLIYYISRCPI